MDELWSACRPEGGACGRYQLIRSDFLMNQAGRKPFEDEYKRVVALCLFLFLLEGHVLKGAILESHSDVE